MIFTSMTFEAEDRARGMTLEEVMRATSQFEDHKCFNPDELPHPIKVRIGWRNQITSLEIICGDKT